MLETIVCYAKYIPRAIISFLMDAVEMVLSVIIAPLSAALSILPTWPGDLPEMPRELIGYMNWLLPMGSMITIFTGLITAYGIYRVVYFTIRRVKQYTHGIEAS